MASVDENLARLKALKAKMLEAIDFTISEAEAEARKKEATPTEFQTE